ncbi:50S ribosomal protein L16 [Candidatus Parcubacteria bacterium]|nr:50S ribosomal protein L16 [Candidatus Parcubacteria bacterium]
MLQPRKTKYRKAMKGRSKGIDQKGATLAFGSFGLKSLETKWITASQIESARRAITRSFKRKGRVWVRIFPDKPITAKGAETPMGGGKGAVNHYVFPIKPGRILFEIEGIEEAVAKEAFKRASNKLPIRVKFVKREL